MSLIVKICGLSTPETLDVAIEEGADMVGFVFFPPSPRHVSFATAGALGEQVRGRAKKVALTVDADDAMLDAIIKSLQPDFLQLHGTEAPARVAALKRRFELPVIKALGVKAKSDYEQLKHYADVGAWILFDAKAPPDATRPGGLGKPLDWHLLRSAIPDVLAMQPEGLGRPFDWHLLSGAIPGVLVMLSGGLSADNVGEALTITRVPAVDVSSGVESAPGVKDVAKIREFVRAARRAHIHLPPYEVVS
jgi:phosphoribosylanthranilate isomerase